MTKHKTDSEKDKELRRKFIAQFRNAPKPDRNIAEYLSYYTQFNSADDYITVTEAASRSMLRLWSKKLEESQKALKDNEDVKDVKNFFSYATGDKISEEGAFGCPTDLFMSGTVPLPSVELVQLEPEKNDFGKGENTMHFMGQSGRVFIFDDFKAELIRAQRGEAAKGKFAVVGYTEVFHPEIRGIHTAEYILVDPETEYTFCSDEYAVIDVNNTGMANDWGRFADKRVDVDLLIKHQHSLLMMDWYSIQIAMLHPLVKERFGTVRTIKERTPKELLKKDPTLPAVKYVKHITLDAEEIEENSYINEKDKNGIVRRTLIWHVTGHYRTRMGHREWVKPYFKGPARWMKQQETRDRNVVDTSVEVGETYTQKDGSVCTVTFVDDGNVVARAADGTEVAGTVDELKEGRLYSHNSSSD